MRYFPLFVDLKDRLVVVVGGGPVAERKLGLLTGSGARLRLVAPALTPALAAARDAGRLEHRARAFEAADLDGARFVVAASDQRDVNRSVAAAAEARAILVNVVDDLELSGAILPAIVDRSPVVVAISTQGGAPALARRLREQIEAVVDGSLGRIAAFAAAWRARVKAAIGDLGERRRFYDWLVDGPAGELVRHGRAAAAGRLVAAALRRHARAAGAPAAPRRGSVALVGAGPGDPGLLTLAALRALQSADVVLHDRLVSPPVLALARREAELIEVGKSGGGHSTGQAEIHRLLAEHARRGRRVVRLKGGDPMIFGRGGEELEYLRRAGIRYEVVPGVTAALACAAYAGIPLTHREHSASVRFVTAHCRESVDATDWRALAAGRETLAVYMGLGTLPLLCRELQRHGRSGATPVAFVENGSRPEQRVLLGTLDSIEALAAGHGLRSPALLIVGAVAALASRLHWFGAEPLVSGTAAARSAA
ncbi:MAG TPA: siroheme synthase CysG [Steroidobacteraceae bacterium]|nr:siroheme synthase CysG [Steroidobacteraceae bacterium]